MVVCACGRKKARKSGQCSICYRADQDRRLRRSCVVCSKSFRKKKSSRNAGLCCSRRCGWQLIHLRGVERQRLRVKERPRKHCLQCGVLFIAKRSNAKLCSPACHHLVLLAYAKAKSHVYYWTHRKQLTRTCVQCGRVFPVAGAHRCCSGVCSKENKKHHAKKHAYGTHAQRAKHFGGERDWSIKKEAIFVRDKWRCCLCGCLTPKWLRGSQNPQAPEIDHIVPLSRGGGHVWHNVQCLCRRCNSKKGARALGQLRLAI